MSATVTEETPRFVRRERDHLDVLQQRLDYLRDGEHPERSEDPSYVAGEANALAWALSVITGGLEPMEVRFERLERQVRVLISRLGRLEQELEQEED